MEKKNAFTLAETLITLVIIGVVAALTIPTLMHRYLGQQYKTAFLKAHSEIGQALGLVKSDLGGESVFQYVKTYSDSYCGTSALCMQYGSPYFANLMYAKFSGAAQCTGGGGDKITTSCANTSNYFTQLYYTYNGKNMIWNTEQLTYKPLVTKSGSFMTFGAGNHWASIYQMYVIVDTNGINSKPNKFGYDTFMFQILSGDKLVPVGGPGTGNSALVNFNANTYCQTTDINYNGWGCAYWAFKDRCPDGTNRSYWDCLP